MSVRAYKVNDIDYEKEATFNLWHDVFIVEKLPVNHWYNENNEIVMFEVDKSQVRRLLKNFDKEWESYITSQYTEKSEHKRKEEYQKTLQKMLGDCGDIGYTQYYCY